MRSAMNLGRMMVTEELELEIFEVSAISFGDEYIFERSFMCATDDSKESFCAKFKGYTINF